MKKQVVLIVFLGLLGLIAGGYYGLINSARESTGTLARLQDIALPDIEKKLRHGEEWMGKVVVVNHWATWCPPCREEIPMLIDYQENREGEGVQIIGIAHDMLDTTRSYGDQIGINYPSLVAITGGAELLQSQGNQNAGALPYTAVFDRNGNLVTTRLGKLTAQELDELVQPLL